MPLRGQGLTDPDSQNQDADNDNNDGTQQSRSELRYVLHPNVSIEDM